MPVTSSTKKAGAIGGSVAAMIIAGIFAVEGGYVDHHDDPGGPTKGGITQVVARDHGYTGDMKALPKELAASIYYDDYIVKPGYAPFLDLAPAVAEELVDSAVNVGPDRPSHWLQTSLNAFSQRGEAYPQVEVDGKVGDKTIQAYRALQKQRGPVLACQLMVKSLDAQQGNYYLALVTKNPKLQSFTVGWMTNRIGNVPMSHCN